MSMVIPLRRLRATVLAAVAIVLASSLSSLNAQAPQAAATATRQSTAVSNAAGQAPAAGTTGAKDVALPVGRVIYAELMQTIDVRKVKAGEPIYARVTLGVLSHGKVLVPEGARIEGHVTEAKERSKNDPESVLGIVFDRAETVDGKELPLELTVQAMGVGALRPRSDIKLQEGTSYSMAPGATSIEDAEAEPGGDRDEHLPQAETKPALDLGSKGMVGLKQLDLSAGKDPTQGSLVTSREKNVKLDNGWQLVLRVVGLKGDAVKK
jgi:hypothetical protein